MKYIRVSNTGEIDPQAIHLVGASTKRNDATKIGQFGSGNKYALAYLLRNHYEVKIFSGERDIEIKTQTHTLREMDFDVIYIDGEKTSITTEMGKDWKFWQALREIYCNAIDEGGFSVDFVSNFAPVPGQTHFYIERKGDAVEFISNFDNYFAKDKKVLFECEYGKILEKSGTTANIYRKGIRAFETNKSSVYDYDFTDLTIDENRLATYHWQIQEKIWQLIYLCDDKEIILKIIHDLKGQKNIEGDVSEYASINSTMSEVFTETVKSIRTAPAGFAGTLKPDEVNQHAILPTKIFNSIRGVIGDENVGDNFKVNRFGSIYQIVEPTELQAETLKQAMYFFKEVGYRIDFPVVVAIFEKKHILGAAHDGNIVVSDIAIEKGVNDLVNTIIEEQIHLRYDVKDETREFQTMCIAEFVTYMKMNNSFIL